jgi:hypothetical protein
MISYLIITALFIYIMYEESELTHFSISSLVEYYKAGMLWAFCPVIHFLIVALWLSVKILNGLRIKLRI